MKIITQEGVFFESMTYFMLACFLLNEQDKASGLLGIITQYILGNYHLHTSAYTQRSVKN